MRVRRRDFIRKPFRVHAFLADVPLHDVWAMHMRGGGDARTLEDFGVLLWYHRPEHFGIVASSLFRLRLTLGRWIGWDEEKHRATESSYAQRITDDDRARSIDKPGSASGLIGMPTTVVYAFENEELHEIRNFTGHHFLLMSMEKAPQGYTVYWAIYTRRTSWFTPLYMALIDPFRRLLLYPIVIRKLERAWKEAYAGQTSPPNPAAARADKA